MLRRKYQQYGPCVQAIFPFLMTMLLFEQQIVARLIKCKMFCLKIWGRITQQFYIYFTYKGLNKIGVRGRDCFFTALNKTGRNCLLLQTSSRAQFLNFLTLYSGIDYTQLIIFVGFLEICIPQAISCCLHI